MVGLLFFAVFWMVTGELSAKEEAVVTFQFRGKKLASRSVSSLAESLKTVTVTVNEGAQAGKVTYQGLPLREVMEAVYGPKWVEQGEIQVTCADGYQPSVPVSYAVKHRAIFAYRRADAGSFHWKKPNADPVALGPLYLVWDNLGDSVLARDGKLYWPYQVVGLNLVPASELFGELVPGPDAPPEVVSGFTEFRTRCYSCHSLNGRGGQIGPELNFPVNITEYFDHAMLRKWLASPQSVRHGAKMSAFPEIAGSEARFQALLAYLKAMKAKKRKPESN